MKRFFSFLTAVFILFSVSINTIAETTQSTSINNNLVFELDFSNFDSTASDLGLTTTTYEQGVREMQVAFQGTPEISVETVDGVSALKLGTKGGVIITDSKSNMFNSANTTLETWVYKDDFSVTAPDGWPKFFGLTSSSNMEFGFVFNKKVSTDAQALNIYPAAGHEIKGPSYFLEDQWQHVVLTRRNNDAGTGTVVNLYINGKLKATYEGNKAATAASKLWIGDYTTSAVNAAFATFKVYNKELSADEAKNIFDAEKDIYGATDEEPQPDPGPGENPNPDPEPGTDPEPEPDPEPEQPSNPQAPVVDLNWENYDPSSSAANKGMTNNGQETITVGYNAKGAPRVETISTQGGEKKVLRIEKKGTNTNLGFYVDTTNAISTDGVTMETWVKKDNFEAASGSIPSGPIFQLCGGTSSSNRQIRWYISAKQDSQDNIEFRICNSNAYDAGQVEKYTYNDYHTTDTWEHMVMTLKINNGTAVGSVYVNGNLKHQITLTGKSAADCKRIMIGGYDPDWDIAANMYIGSFKVYNGALTQQQIMDKFVNEKAIYSGNIPQFAQTSIQQPEYTNNTIEIGFDRDITNLGITSDKLFVVNKNGGKKIGTTISQIDAQNKSAVLKLSEMLMPGEEYIIKVVGDPLKLSPFDDEISFVVEELAAKPDIDVTKGASSLTIDVQFDDTAIGKKCSVLAVVYDDTGRVVNIPNTMKEITVASTNKTCQVVIDSTSFSAGYKVETYAWDCSGTTSIPVINEPVITEY